MAGAVAAPGLGQFDTPLRGLTFPINLRPIGIDRELTNFADIGAIGLGMLQGIQLNNFAVVRVPDGYGGHNNRIQFRNAEAGGANIGNFISAIGDVSTFGMLASITGGKCIKLQKIGGHGQSLQDYLREIIIQFIFYESTKYNNHYDCPYVPKVYGVYRFNRPASWPAPAETWIAYVQEYYEHGRTINNRIDNARNTFDGTTELILTARKLQNLWSMYQFNHGDFHPGNIMCINPPGGGTSIRIIDFGKSIININGSTLHGNPADPYTALRSSQGRDLTALFSYISQIHATALISGNQIIRDGYNQIILDGHPVLIRNILAGLNRTHWHATYNWFNGAGSNPAAYPATVIQTYYARRPAPALIGDDQATCAGQLPDPAVAAAQRNAAAAQGARNAAVAQAARNAAVAQAARNAAAAQARRNAARNATKDQADALVAHYERIRPELDNLRGQIVALSNQLGVAADHGPEIDATVAYFTANAPAFEAAYTAAAAVPRTNTQAQWTAILPQIQELVRLATSARAALTRRVADLQAQVAAAQAAAAAAAQVQRNAEAAARAAIEQRSDARLRVEEAFARLQAVQEEYRRLETQNTELYRRLHGSSSNPPDFRNIQRFRESFDAHINQTLARLRAERDRGAARTNTAQNWLDLLPHVEELVRMAEARREAARTSIAQLTRELAEIGIEGDVTQVNELSIQINRTMEEIEAMRLQMEGLTGDLDRPQGVNPEIDIDGIISTFRDRLRTVRDARNNPRGRRNRRENWQAINGLMTTALTNLRALRGRIRERINNLEQQTQDRATNVMGEVDRLIGQINARINETRRLLANPGIQINAGIQVPADINQRAETQYENFGILLQQAREGGLELDLWNTAKQAATQALEAQQVKHQAILAIILEHALEASRGEVRTEMQAFENQMRAIDVLRESARGKETNIERFATELATNLRPGFDDLLPSFPEKVATIPIWQQVQEQERIALATFRPTNNVAGLNANRARGAREAWRRAVASLPPLLAAQQARDQAADRILSMRGDFQQAIQDRSQVFTVDDERQKAEYERILEERGLINDTKLAVDAAKAEYERLLLVAFRSNRLEDLRQAYDSLLELTTRERIYKTRVLTYLPELLQIGPQLPIASAPAAAAAPNAVEAIEAAAPNAAAPDIMGQVWAGLRYVGGIVGLAGGKRRVYKTRKMRVKRGGRAAVATRSRQPNMNTSTFINRNTKVLAKKLNSVRPRQNVLATQNVKSQLNRMEPINLDILKFSGEYILDYMRFVVFPTLDAETMGAILYNMSTIPLRDENVASDLAKVMNSRSLDMLNEFIKKYTVKDIDEQLDAQNWPKNYKNMKTCIELYMGESDPKVAFNILRGYMYCEFVSQEAHDSYVNWVKSLDSNLRKVALGGYHFNAINI